MTDVGLLVRATLRMYAESLREAALALRLNWWGMFLPVVYTILLTVLAPVVGAILPGIAGGFLLGILLTILLANFLAVVAASVENERLRLKDLWAKTRDLILPLISVLFALWILSLVFTFILSKPSHQFLLGAFNLVLVVLFNPLPEVTYQSNAVQVMSNSISAFSESLEFMRENSIEWIIGFLLVLSPLLVVNPEVVLYTLASGSPMDAVFGLLRAFATVSFSASFGNFWILLVMGLIVGYYAMLFRGVLFKKLSRSSRRKRIYQERFG